MKRIVVMAVAGALFAIGRAEGQTSLDVIQDDLRAAKEAHDTANSEMMHTFLSTLEAASLSPSTALDLYSKAGGNLPDAAPVRAHYEYETPSEKEKREEIDAQNFESVAIVIQVHCGLMRNAALLALTPKAPGVQEQWMDWLKTTAEIYPQLSGRRALKDVSMRDSVVSHYLGFHSWGNSEMGGWTVAQLPQIYRDQVLEPLRHPPGPGTMDAWDTYIAMRQADEPDKEKWSQQEEPALDFDRDADDFTIQPTIDKLAALDAIIKANPGDDHLDDWIARMQTMIDIYRRGGTATGLPPGATPGTPSSAAPGVMPTASPGIPSSGTTGVLPTATPGTPISGTGAPLPTASPGTPVSGTTAQLPTASPGTPVSGTTAQLPTASPGTPVSGTTAQLPTASPGTPVSGTVAPLPTASPGTPVSGTAAPIPAATPGTVTGQ
jgi:hypothetical protein